MPRCTRGMMLLAVCVNVNVNVCVCPYKYVHVYALLLFVDLTFQTAKIDKRQTASIIPFTLFICFKTSHFAIYLLEKVKLQK